MPEPDDADIRVPVIEESITVDKVLVQTDAVQILTSVEVRDVVVEETLDREVLTVRRVPLDHLVEVAPPLREDGSTTILSIVEERAIVVKQLFLIEEVHITRERTQEPVAIPVELRRTHARVDRPGSSEPAEPAVPS